MARVTSFVYCLNAERIPDINGNGESINAHGIMSTLNPEFIPGTFSFSIIFSILDMDVTKVGNDIKILFKDQDGNDLVDTGDISIPVMEEGDVNLPAEHKGLNISLDFRNVVFEKEGQCVTEVYYKGELLDSYPIYAKGRR